MYQPIGRRHVARGRARRIRGRHGENMGNCVQQDKVQSISKICVKPWVTSGIPQSTPGFPHPTYNPLEV